MIAFCQFGCSKTDRNTGRFCVVFDQMHNTVQTTVYSTAMIFCITEILSAGLLLVFCDMHGMCDQFADAFIFCGRNGNNGNTEHFLHLVD